MTRCPNRGQFTSSSHMFHPQGIEAQAQIRQGERKQSRRAKPRPVAAVLRRPVSRGVAPGPTEGGLSMNRKTILALMFVIAAAIAAFLLPANAPKAQAQPNCPSFHALIQAELFPENPLREGDVWGGNVYAYLGQEILLGRYSGNSGETSSRGWTNTGTTGSDVFDFGNGNAFTASAAHDVFPTPPGLMPEGVGGMYRAADKIVEGTGIFRNATGNLSVSGPFVVWGFDQPLPRGRWNGEVSGSVCGIQ